ncbi:hypothetical protein [Persephonella sp. KM09-Lau-8]|uniref:hypothetical protein n=1 Tax=Persephonella sp. KM09-Lau-8 TaxID=1158345 RepID=UPI0004963D69|nr:hypothetical protein [Persephonella sp. KM09-Lau-8]
MTSVEITVNRSYKDFISEKELAQIIKEMKKAETERIYILFTEVPVKELIAFSLRNNIPFENLKNYYLKYIKSIGFKKLERMFGND